MEGYLFAILTGVFFGVQGTFSKILTRKLSPVLLTWGIFTFSVPYLLIMLFIKGIPNILWNDFLWSTGVSFLVNVVAWNLYFRALEASSLSHTMPFTAFTPLFLIPVAFILLGEMPDLNGIIGILLIISGGYGIHLHSGDFLAPFKSLVTNRGTRYMLIIALIWSVSATVEKVAVLSSSQVFYGFIISALLSIAYLPYILWSRRTYAVVIKSNLWGLFILGLISGLLIICQFTALKYLLVSYVIGLKRAGIIVSVFFGILIFKEPNPVKNLFSTLLMVAGVFLIMW